jgi:hypothetical protein
MRSTPFSIHFNITPPIVEFCLTSAQVQVQTLNQLLRRQSKNRFGVFNSNAFLELQLQSTTLRVVSIHKFEIIDNDFCCLFIYVQVEILVRLLLREVVWGGEVGASSFDYRKFWVEGYRLTRSWRLRIWKIDRDLDWKDSWRKVKTAS